MWKSNKNIRNENYLNILNDIQKQAINLGYNIYDPNLPLYSDICLSYSIDSKDSSVLIRKELIFKNQEVCEDSCITEYISQDKIICNPFNKQINENTLLDNELISKFTDVLGKTNIEYFKKIYDRKTYKSNIFFYISIIPTICILISSVYFLSYKKKKIIEQLEK